MLGLVGFWFHAENIPSLKNQNFENMFGFFILKKKGKIDIFLPRTAYKFWCIFRGHFMPEIKVRYPKNKNDFLLKKMWKI